MLVAPVSLQVPQLVDFGQWSLFPASQKASTLDLVYSYEGKVLIW